jgi:glycosyltransferase involved in cell wall biosynthesis
MITPVSTVTVVIPTFNRPELLVRAVQSVLAQTSPPDEVIAVDNGTRSVPDDLLPSTVRLLRITPRAGVSAARNAGAIAARSDYVAFLDDDDRWDSDYLLNVRAAIAASPRQPDVVIGRKDREIDGTVAPYKQITSLDGLRDVLMVKNPGIGGQNVTVRTSFMQDAGLFRESLRSGEDRAFLIDALNSGALVRLAPLAVAVKVIHSGEQITDGRHAVRNAALFLQTYWGVMTWHQRRRNLRKLARALAATARHAGRSRLETHE